MSNTTSDTMPDTMQGKIGFLHFLSLALFAEAYKTLSEEKATLAKQKEDFKKLETQAEKIENVEKRKEMLEKVRLLQDECSRRDKIAKAWEVLLEAFCQLK